MATPVVAGVAAPLEARWPVLKSTPQAVATLLFNTEIMVEDGITVSGMLLFGRTPNRFLPQAGIDAAAFPGNSKDYGARERSALRGALKIGRAHV